MPVEQSEGGTVSLVFAVTGHRDVFAEDENQYEEAIQQILLRERNKYPSTQLLLLSGLAEGADRIGVRAAKALNIPYMAVLPMVPELYCDDFTSAGSTGEFGKLLQGAARVIVMPTVQGVTRFDISHEGEARDRQYQSLGQGNRMNVRNRGGYCRRVFGARSFKEKSVSFDPSGT